MKDGNEAEKGTILNARPVRCDRACVLRQEHLAIGSTAEQEALGDAGAGLRTLLPSTAVIKIKKQRHSAASPTAALYRGQNVQVS